MNKQQIEGVTELLTSIYSQITWENYEMRDGKPTPHPFGERVRGQLPYGVPAVLKMVDVLGGYGDYRLQHPTLGSVTVTDYTLRRGASAQNVRAISGGYGIVIYFEDRHVFVCLKSDHVGVGVRHDNAIASLLNDPHAPIEAVERAKDIDLLVWNEELHTTSHRKPEPSKAKRK